MKNVKYYKLKDIAYIMKGFRDFIATRADPGYDDYVKVLSYLSIKKYILTGNTDEIQYKELNLSKKYKNGFVEGGDIIIPIMSRSVKNTVLYIDKAPNEQCIYNDTNLIIRITDNNINKKYVAIVLDSLMPKWAEVQQEFKKSTTLSKRLTVGFLEDVKIPIPKKEEQDVIVRKYEEATKQLAEIDKQIKELTKNRE